VALPLKETPEPESLREELRARRWPGSTRWAAGIADAHLKLARLRAEVSR